MKKLRTLLTILITLSLVVVGCSSKSKNDNKTDNSKGYKIGIVTGEGGAKDKSFNQANVEAIQAWVKENGAKDPVVIETKTQSDLSSNVQNAAKVSDIISVAGYEFEKELMQQSVENTYSIFLDRVAEGRKKTSEAVDSVGQGRVWSGLDALRLGLVDELGGLDRAIAVAAERANITDNYRLSVYPKQELSFFDGMLNNVLTAKVQLAKQFFGISDPEQEFVENIERLLKKRGIRAEMPYMIEIR